MKLKTGISTNEDFIKAMSDLGQTVDPKLPAENLRTKLDLVNEEVNVTFQSTNETVLQAVNEGTSPVHEDVTVTIKVAGIQEGDTPTGTIGDEIIASFPVEVTRAYNTRETLNVECEGYSDETLEVVFDENKEVVVTLYQLPSTITVSIKYDDLNIEEPFDYDVHFEIDYDYEGGPETCEVTREAGALTSYLVENKEVDQNTDINVRIISPAGYEFDQLGDPTEHTFINVSESSELVLPTIGYMEPPVYDETDVDIIFDGMQEPFEDEVDFTVIYRQQGTEMNETYTIQANTEIQDTSLLSGTTILADEGTDVQIIIENENYYFTGGSHNYRYNNLTGSSVEISLPEIYKEEQPQTETIYVRFNSEQLASNINFDQNGYATFDLSTVGGAVYHYSFIADDVGDVLYDMDITIGDDVEVELTSEGNTFDPAGESEVLTATINTIEGTSTYEMPLIYKSI